MAVSGVDIRHYGQKSQVQQQPLTFHKREALNVWPFDLINDYLVVDTFSVN